MSEPGFRINAVDVVFLLLCAGATGYGLHRWGDPAWGIPFAAGHFFLFCNVFRVRRSYELAWVAVFFANAGTLLALGRFGWPLVLAIQSPFTLLAIGAELRSPTYHGIGWSRLRR